MIIRILYSVSVRVSVCVMLWSVNQGVTQHLNCPLLGSCFAAWQHEILLSVEPVVADADVAIWDFCRKAEIFLMSSCRGGRVIHWPSIRICSLWLRESSDVTLHSNLYISQIFWRSQEISRLFVVCAWCVGSVMGGRGREEGRGRGKVALCKLIHRHGLTRNIVTWGLTLDSDPQPLSPWLLQAFSDCWVNAFFPQLFQFPFISINSWLFFERSVNWLFLSCYLR